MSKSALDSREALRRSYLPSAVRVLFIGESPPASGRFFYQADSGLYRAMRETFAAFDPRFDTPDFLAAFREFGYYLVDLCAEPVDRLAGPARRAARRAGEAPLASAIMSLRPHSVAILLRSIEGNVGRAMSLAGWDGPRICLPYPGRWARHRKVFAAELKRHLGQGFAG